MGQLFGKDKRTISEHIGNIFKEGELDEKVVVRKFRTTTQHGAIEKKIQDKEVKYYNLKEQSLKEIELDILKLNKKLKGK